MGVFVGCLCVYMILSCLQYMFDCCCKSPYQWSGRNCTCKLYVCSPLLIWPTLQKTQSDFVRQMACDEGNHR